MAYGDYGSFVYLNGKRRADKEDVGVYDTDEASLPTGLRVYANIMKHGGGGCEWFEFSHHGVMGDGSVRVGCYKHGWPEVYEWEDGEDKPTQYTFDDLSRKFGWDDYEEYDDTRYAADKYDEGMPDHFIDLRWSGYNDGAWWMKWSKGTETKEQGGRRFRIDYENCNVYELVDD